ncbi:flagellar basal-body MS-ring/collar protein FliF [Virgibacillus sp. CBA3643]|uniref:flagellar basal-body MS-ring/collar protein FliF n=1 Tax=Virgibacillus sp. CBA3643 TaxID=2942278 RepID=UPI0035A3550C
MKEKMNKWKGSASTFWRGRSKSQKWVFIGSILIVIMLIAGITFFTANSKFVPLYNDLSLQESGQIKTELDSRGVTYELEDGGTTIRVPGEQVDSLLVDLAGQGIPNSGNIDYSFFSENSSWGITDNEFDVMRLDAMQTELANLIQGVEGIESADVMINLPEEPVFASETTKEGSASIVLNTQPGYQFEGNQINALHHLVSKAVPNLPEDNIAIMDQYFEYFDQDSGNANSSQDVHTYQQTVKQDVERDIQRRLQQMLGTMVGMDNVIVSVTADIDFTQENRTEELVEPIDIANMEGLPVSIETIQEAYSGNPPVGGTTGTGEEDTAGTYQEVEGEDGEYELEKETVNNEFNRIRRDIVESPYNIRDLGIQVAVNRIAGSNEDGIEYLTQQEANSVEDGISSILDSIVSTSMDEEYSEETGEENLSIVFQEFTGNEAMPESKPIIPTWLYVIGAILLAIIIILVFLLLRRRKEDETYVEETITTEPTPAMEVPEQRDQQESESVTRRKELEKMAKDNPEDFAKLLRSWIGED